MGILDNLDASYREAKIRIKQAQKDGSVKLDLRKLGLTAVPPEIGQLTALTELYLSNNWLTAVPPEIGQLTQLRKLYLYGNRLTTVPPEIAQLTNLQTLWLGSNNLTTIPFEITQLTNLQALELQSGRLTTILPEIAQLTNLQTLYLNHNQLTMVPSEVAQLTNLQTLYLNSNRLILVPPEVAQLINLRELFLSNNLLTTIPFEIGQLMKLQTLGLSRNRLMVVPPEIGQLMKLQTLDLSHNELTAIPPEIGQLMMLTELDLSRNRLTAVPPEIGQLIALQTLRLSGNELTSVPLEIGQLANIHELGLGTLELIEIPPEFARLTNLRIFNLYNNKLTVIPKWLIQMLQLEKLYIIENPITQPPPELLGKALTAKFISDDGAAVDLEKIRRYYAQLEEEGGAYFYESKLLLIGEGGAGKTSLACKLLSPTQSLPVVKESTEGIDIHCWQFPVFASADLINSQNLSDIDQQYTVNVWDFGGQSVYHATHQFFLSKRSVYILLADTRRQQTDFYDWLQMQEAFGENSPILLLKNQNRSHGNECVIDNLPYLQKRFPNLKEIVELDLGNVPAETNWEPLLTYLQKHLLNLDHIGQPSPKTWVEVRQTLRGSSHDQIHRRDFLKLCNVCGIDDEADALQLSDYLHHVGDILHFEDDPILKELVILNPTWALDAVYRVLDNTEIIASNGRFSRQQLHALWAEAKYDGHRVQLLRLMQNFQLCYQLPGSPDDFIAPQLLESEAPGYIWDDNPDDLQLRYKYPLFMPRGILNRAIVTLHKLIADGLVWRVGVILHDEYARAELLELRGEKEIRIRVSGGNKRDLLMQIVRTLDDLHNSFSAKLKYDKQIPCRCATCTQLDDPYFFNLDKLLGRLAHNKPTDDCGNAPYETMQIPHLIGDIIPQAKAGDNYVFVGGDYIKVGDIEGGQGLAFGRQARASRA